jgi:protein TonB
MINRWFVAVPALAASISMPALAAPERPASCLTAHAQASIVRSVEPDYPTLAAMQHVTGTSVVQVDLSERGTVLSTAILKSSGSRALDRAAMQTARETIYQPETQACKPISGSYALEVHFAE